MIETIREDIFEIFNLIQGGGTRENPQQDKIVCLDYEVDRLKSQVKDLHLRNGFEQLNNFTSGNNLNAPLTQRKITTAEFSTSRSRRNITSYGRDSFNIK